LRSKREVLVTLTSLVEYVRVEFLLLSKGVTGPCFQWCDYHWESRGVFLWKYRSTSACQDLLGVTGSDSQLLH